MLSGLLAERARLLAASIAKVLARSGISPNLVTVLGLLLNTVVAYFLAGGHLLLGGALVLFAGAFDMLDGALARVTGSSSRFGAFLDSTLDRYSEAVIYLGLLIFFLRAPGSQMESILIYVIVVGSIMVSYTRARAEALDMKCEVGLLARPERVVVLAAGLLLTPFVESALLVALWILAIFTHVTALQRILYIWVVSRRAASAE